MTVSSSTSRSGPYTGNGSTTVFARDFLAFDEDHVAVYQTVDGVRSEVTTGITHNGIGSVSGDVTFTTAPVSGVTIDIIREVPNVQASDYSNQGKVAPETVERDFDLLAMQVQDLRGDVGALEDASEYANAAAASAQTASEAEAAATTAAATVADLWTPITAFGVASNAAPDAATVTANTTAMQTAVDSGDALLVPVGTFVFDHIDLPETLSMIGAGEQSVLRKSGETRHLMERALGSATGNISFSNLTLDGDCDSQATVDWDNQDSLVYFGADAGSLTVSGCWIKNPRGRGIYTRSTGAHGAAKADIRGNAFVGGREAIMDSGTPSNSKVTVHITITDTSEYFLTGNRHDLGYDPTGPGVCAIQVTTFDTLNTFRPSKGTIIGNAFDRLGQGGSVPGSGSLGVIDLYKNAGRCVISGNRLYRSTARGIALKSDSGDVTISGNVIHSSQDLGAPDTAMGEAIVVNRSVEDTGDAENGITIIGNRIRAVPVGGITVTGDATTGADYSTGILIGQNNIEGVTGWGIRVSAAGKVSIQGNLLGNLTGNAIHILDPRDFHSIKANVIGTDVGDAFVIGSNVDLVWASDNDTRFAAAFSANDVVGAAGTLKVWRDWHFVSSDGTNISTIEGGREGATMTLIAGSGGGGTATLVDGTNLKLTANWTATANAVISLIKQGGVWREISRAANG